MDIIAQRQRIVEEAKTWLKTPYHHHGDIKGVGVDCAMFLVKVYSDLGLIHYFDPRPYSPQWHLHHSEEIYLGFVEKYAKKVDVPLPGDVVLYKVGRCVAHGGIVVDWPTIIHVVNRIGCALDDGTQGMLRYMDGKSRLYGFYSLFQGPVLSKTEGA